jgi:hypothetical protein
MNSKSYLVLGAAVLAVAALATFTFAGSATAKETVTTVHGIELHDVPAQTVEFIGYDDSIELTPEQEAIRVEALSALPAPCCKDNTAATCCCPCVMAKSTWGLSKYQITEKGAGVEEVRQAASDWQKFIEPEGGFSGDICYTGSCNKAFHADGCGGMNPADPIF